MTKILENLIVKNIKNSIWSEIAKLRQPEMPW